MHKKMIGSRVLTDVVKRRLLVRSRSNATVVDAGSSKHHEKPQLDVEWENAKPFEDIPGPKGIIETLRKYMPGGPYYKKDMVEINKLSQKEYGNLMKFKGAFGRRDIVMTFDPDDVAKVFRTEGLWPTRRGADVITYYRHHVNTEVFKDVGGLLGEQGENWHKLRTTVNPIMLQPKNIRLYVGKVDDVARDFIKCVKQIRDQNNETPANFSEHLNRWSLETIGVIALDTRLGVLDEKKETERAKVIIKSVRDFFHLTNELEMKPSLWRYFPTPAYKKMLLTLENLTKSIMHYVDEALVRIETNPTLDPNNQGVLEKLLKIDRQTAVIMAYDMLLGGVDTTTSASIIVLYHLAKNPAKQQILRDEILKVLPSKDTLITHENIKNIPYMRAVIKESLRMVSPVIGNLRATGQNIVLQGYKIPKDTDVAMSASTIYENDEYFPRSKAFIPERWLKNIEVAECPVGKGKAHPFKYVPFGFGPRACIGKRFAELEIEILVMRLIREFTIEWSHSDLKFVTGVVTFAEGDLKFKMVENEN